MGLKNTFIGLAIGAGILCLLKDTSRPDDPREISSVAGNLVAHNGDVATAKVVKNNRADDVLARPDPPLSTLPPKPLLDGAFPPCRHVVKKPQRAEEFPQRAGHLRELLADSIKDAAVQLPSPLELRRFEDLFLQTLTLTDNFKQLAEDWADLDWKTEIWQASGKRFLAIAEPEDQRRGRGFYVICLNSKSRIALQAPHRFYDTGTGLLTRKLFEENDVLVAAWNTVHRNQIDLSHYRQHYINALTRALIRFDHQIVVAQLHGFDNDKRASTASGAAMIISDTTRYPGRLVRRAAEEQKMVLGAEAVRLFPSEVSELGGTQNQQAREFHNLHARGFLHLELGRLLREKLIKDDATRAQFFSGLTSAAANWHDPHDR